MEAVPRITDIDPALSTSWLRHLRYLKLTGTVRQP
jgi:hypothetical protein